MCGWKRKSLRSRQSVWKLASLRMKDDFAERICKTPFTTTRLFFLKVCFSIQSKWQAPQCKIATQLHKFQFQQVGWQPPTGSDSSWSLDRTGFHQRPPVTNQQVWRTYDGWRGGVKWLHQKSQILLSKSNYRPALNCWCSANPQASAQQTEGGLCMCVWGGGVLNQKKCHINSDKFKQSRFLIKLSYLHPVTYTRHRFRLIPVTSFWFMNAK